MSNHRYSPLSILIPIYNFQVIPLVHDLTAQCNDLNMEYEIICVDDFSSPEYQVQNQDLKAIENCTYLKLEKNAGRSKIRNHLAQLAKYKWLLYMDCDSIVPNHNFIKKYVELIEKNKHEVVYGGRIHPKNVDSSVILRYKYGRQREEKPAALRSKNPYLSFMTNNFVISKELYVAIKSDESIIGYGYEDVRFALELQQKNIPILHIDNPLVHIGLEKNKVFIDKTNEGMRNLALLIQNNKIDQRVKIVKYFKLLKRFNAFKLFQKMYALIDKKIFKNLHSNKPSLFYFDLYKLNRLIESYKTTSNEL